MSLEEYISLRKMNKRCRFLLGVVAEAFILHSVIEYMCCNRFHSEALKLFSTPFKHRQAPSRVKSIYPDRQTFAFRHVSPVWVEFNTSMNKATITEETITVRSPASKEPVS